MKVFVRKLLFFSLGFVLVFFVFFVGSNAFIAKGNYFNIPEQIDTLILGHSHSACAFNDSLIDNTYNISQNAEGYPYSYFKARTVLENNDHIKKVIIEVTNNQIDPWADNRISGLYLDVNAPRSFPVLDPNFVMETVIDSKRPDRIMQALYKGGKSNMGFITGEEENYIRAKWKTHKTPSREFVPSSEIAAGTNNVDPRVSKGGQAHSKKKNVDDPVSEKNIAFLKKIVDLCDTSGVHLYFVRSPFPSISKPNNEKQFQSILESQFPNVPFWDFKNFPLPNNKFADKQHLNANGQRLFSRFFNGLLEQGLLSWEDPQPIIYSEMEKFKLLYHERNQLH